MSLLESIRIALNAIRGNALRSALTILMIVIGVGCVIIGAAFGSGTQAAVQEQMSTLGANVLSIYPGQSFGRGGVASSNRVSLTIDDCLAWSPKRRCCLMTRFERIFDMGEVM